MNFRVGLGYDSHAIVSGSGLMLGNCLVDDRHEFSGHSDGDVLIHSVIDALLGASGHGDDIGQLFPDNEPAWHGISSAILLTRTMELLGKDGWQIVNVDVVLIGNFPKIAPVKDRIRKRMSDLLKIPENRFNLKGKTREGYPEDHTPPAMCAHCVLLLNQIVRE